MKEANKQTNTYINKFKKAERSKKKRLEKVEMSRKKLKQNNS